MQVSFLLLQVLVVDHVLAHPLRVLRVVVSVIMGATTMSLVLVTALVVVLLSFMLLVPSATTVVWSRILGVVS